MSVPVGRVWCLEASEWLGSWVWAPCQEEDHTVCLQGVCLSWVGMWHSHDPRLHRRGILSHPNHVRPQPLQVHSCKFLGMQEGIKSNQITRNHPGFNQDSETDHHKDIFQASTLQKLHLWFFLSDYNFDRFDRLDFFCTPSIQNNILFSLDCNMQAWITNSNARWDKQTIKNSKTEYIVFTIWSHAKKMQISYVWTAVMKHYVKIFHYQVIWPL